MKIISSEKSKSSLKKIFELSVKLIVTASCFWYISKKINIGEAWQAMLTANWWLLSLSVLFYFLSKFVSGLRLNINFRNIKLYLSEWVNMKLYWLGMFYNLFLPGAISGDAYKVVLLKKTHKTPIKKSSAAVLLDRFSGLLGLGVLISFYCFMVLENYMLEIAVIAGTLLSILALYLVVRFFFKEFLAGFFPTFFLGVLVQGLQVISVYFIMYSLGITLAHSQWIFIFLISSAISVLPISLGGGLGTRELVFAEGALFFHLKPELGIIISLLFYLSNLISSVPGAYFIFRNPLLERNASSLVEQEIRS